MKIDVPKGSTVWWEGMRANVNWFNGKECGISFLDAPAYPGAMTVPYEELEIIATPGYKVEQTEVKRTDKALDMWLDL